MSEKHKKRKEKRRKENIKRKLLHNRLLAREERKLEKELWKLKRSQEEKLVPIRKEKNDNQS
jgi:hypothetical protein